MELFHSSCVLVYFGAKGGFHTVEYRNIYHIVVCLNICSILVCIFWCVLVIQTVVDDNIYIMSMHFYQMRNTKFTLSRQTMKWQPSTSGLRCSAANDTTVISSRHYTTVLPVVLKLQQNVKSKLYRHIQYTSRHKSETQPHIAAFGYNPLAPA